MTNKKITKQTIYSLISIIVLIIILSVALPFTLAYLFDDKEQEGDAQVGALAVNFYVNSGTTLLTNGVDIQLSGVGTNKTTDISIYNPHTIPIIARVFISVTKQNDLETLVRTNEVEINFANSVITKNQYSYQAINTATDEWFVYNYINIVLQPKTNYVFINRLKALNASYANQIVSISLYGEGFPYSNNAYKTGRPITSNSDFGNLSSTLLQQWTAWK